MGDDQGLRWDPLEAAKALRDYQARAQVPPQHADDLDITPVEAAEMLKAMTELTVALSAFIVAAEKLYPRLKNGPLASRAAKLRDIIAHHEASSHPLKEPLP